jgi:hypothetical protein
MSNEIQPVDPAQPSWKQKRYWLRGHKRYRPGDFSKQCSYCGNFVGEKYYAERPEGVICRECAKE